MINLVIGRQGSGKTLLLIKKALEYHRLFHQTHKDILDEQMIQHYNELQTSHEAEKRNKEIAKLKSNNQIQQLELNQEKITGMR